MSSYQKRDSHYKDKMIPNVKIKWLWQSYLYNAESSYLEKLSLYWVRAHNEMKDYLIFVMKISISGKTIFIFRQDPEGCH